MKSKVAPGQNEAVVLYAFMNPGNTIPAMTGLDGAPLFARRGKAICAAVSTHAPERLKSLLGDVSPQDVQAQALTYHQSLSILSQAADILPVRFGTVLPSKAALDGYVSAQMGTLSACLDALTGGLEWSIQLVADQPVEASQLSAPGPKSYLRARHASRQGAAALEASRAALANSLVSALSTGPALSVICDAVSDDLAAQRCFAHVRALCPRGADAAVIACISDHVGGADGVTASVHGPGAPFHFAQVEAARHAA